MIVTSAAYTASGMIRAVIDGAEVNVADVPGNRHRAALAAWEAEGNVIEPYAPPPATAQDVNAERRRRLTRGTAVTVPGHADPIRLSGRPEDMDSLIGLAMGAQLRLAAGDTEHVTTFRDADNTDHQLTPPQVLAMWQAGAGWVEQVYVASWAIKDSDPIPADYAEDPRWPA